MFKITTDYDKRQNTTRISKENTRYIPPRLTKITLYYLLYIIPFYRWVNINIIERNDESADLFKINNKQITSPRLSTLLYNKSLLYFQRGLTLALYQYLIIYIIKERIRSNFFNIEEDNIVDLLSNHSSKTADMHYARHQELSLKTTRNL